ncbi:transmembrane and coiled-coil domain-containing protein STS1-like [Silene latifolia]|uniref:transmembrane and coiled-coil domain-containing protein STS1-like n=1 Tax=Silene latifolia TaxID=37657 RepID=UPI003D789038
MAAKMLSPTERYAAGALFGLAINQAQIHQSRPLGSPPYNRFHGGDDGGGDGGEIIKDRISSSSDGSNSSDSVSDDPLLWIHPNSGLLHPIFKFLEIDSSAWQGIEETANASPATHHVGAFLRLLSEETEGSSSEKKDQELALAKGIDGMVASMVALIDSETKRKKQREYHQERREKCSVPEMPETPSTSAERQVIEVIQEKTANTILDEDSPHEPEYKFSEDPVEEERKLSYERKLTVLYELLSASLANMSDNSKKSKQRKGYDARHRVALRLLATWLDVKWVEVEAMETIIACSVMALAKEQELKQEEAKSEESPWAKWKRGGIIGAAAVTGGALMAITGGLAAPAIAAGFSALAPTLGTIIPVIGAGGFAAAASVAGSVAGSVAIAASFGAAGAGLTGTKMARRIGSIEEFEFKAVGNNHGQGRLAVGILVSGFVFDEDDFIMPWEGLTNNLERYVLVWESQHLIAVSTAIQDWLTSRLALQLMKQGAMMTVLSTLLTALAWPATLLAITDFIDSKWTIAVNRSDKAGKLLAEILLKGLQGNRPVTLVGYSLGARVIFKCLKYLSKTEQANLVERVVLLGAPIPIKDENWEAARKVVAGRFVNVFSRNDWILGIAFRASLLSKGLAGIQEVDVPGIENVDATDIIEGHSSYLWATQQILDRLDLDTYFPVFSGASTQK